MENNNEYEFSRKYERKKAAIMRCVARCEALEKNTSRHIPVKCLIVATTACILLSITVFASTEFGFFRIKHYENKTVISVGSNGENHNGIQNYDSIQNTDILNGRIYTFVSASDIQGEVPKLIFHKDYVPESMSDGSDGNGIKFGDFDNGTAISFSITYLGGKNYTYNFGSYAKIESLTVNDNSAIIIRLDETTYFNKILAVYFEEFDVVVDCYLGYAIPDNEIVKLAEGFRFEETDDDSLACQMTKNTGGMTHAGSLEEPLFLPLETSKETKLYESITLTQKFAETEEYGDTEIIITPTDVMTFTDTLALDESHIRADSFKLYASEDGTLVPYPRTHINESDLPYEPDTFGETENVKKVLVLVTLTVKNTSDTDITTYLGGSFSLHVGNGESLAADYVYNRIPQKYTTNGYPAYYDGGGTDKAYYRTELGANEEKVCRVGFLVDEDMLDEAYMLFGSAPDYKYHLKLIQE